MTTRILSLRVNRRAIGAAILTKEGLTWADARHLASGAGRAIPAATRYAERLLKGAGVTAVILDSSEPGLSEVTDSVLDSLRQLCAGEGVSPMTIGRADVLAAYGRPALRSRNELRALVADYWPSLATIRGRLQPYAIDAAAAALYAECRVALNHPT